MHALCTTTRANSQAQTERIVSSANWSPAKRDAERQEIARRYAWAAQDGHGSGVASNPDRLLAKFRLRELERLYHHRYGLVLPDDDGGRDDLEIAAHHIAHLGGEVIPHIIAWASLWCTWMSQAEATALAERVAAKPVKFGADRLAWKLGLKFAERMMLAIKTIGAIDKNKAERLELRREKRRAADRARRAAQRTGKPRGRPAKNARPIGRVSIIGRAINLGDGTGAEVVGRRALRGARTTKHVAPNVAGCPRNAPKCPRKCPRPPLQFTAVITNRGATVPPYAASSAFSASATHRKQIFAVWSGLEWATQIDAPQSTHRPTNDGTRGIVMSATR